MAGQGGGYKRWYCFRCDRVFATRQGSAVHAGKAHKGILRSLFIGAFPSVRALNRYLNYSGWDEPGDS